MGDLKDVFLCLLSLLEDSSVTGASGKKLCEYIIEFMSQPSKISM